ncbi:MAG TPA: 16S rRNA (adenine(1518)-N(6)/adenine(1519)-N(6))-dimethyltransferase RsmA [Anaerovoracaceae bacterium]|nr:16S rRNA (adenine(1518)-N(6)/adenine(1519)-N(6))-dimethyltransferase RsmA [Anaerovoracaceae bacterium]
MDKLYSPATVKKIINEYGFNISKSLGQNFLADKNIVDKIIEGAEISSDDLVIEIGPGLGVLTAAAAERARRVIGIEIDSVLIPILKETLAGYKNIRIINEDFLKTNMYDLISRADLGNKEKFSGVKLIGNLPYYISSPIIMKVLREQAEKSLNIQSLTVMMQKEVGERIRATPGSKTYGALSIAVQYYCTVDTVAKVPGSVFVPKPKIDSVVLRLKIRENPPVKLKDEAIFFSLVKTSFSQRRKTLRNSLVGIREMDKTAVITLLNSARIDPVRRAETLSLDEFAAVANLLAEKVNL